MSLIGVRLPAVQAHTVFDVVGSDSSFLPLHQGDFLFRQVIEGIDETVDFGFELRYGGAVGGGEDLLYQSDDRGLLGDGGGWDGKLFNVYNF